MKGVIAKMWIGELLSHSFPLVYPLREASQPSQPGQQLPWHQRPLSNCSEISGWILRDKTGSLATRVIWYVRYWLSDAR